MTLLQDLVRCPSVTPADEGAQAILMTALSSLGFELFALRFGETENFFARRGGGAPHFCFAGHTDVVPPGAGWRHGPFDGEVVDGVLYGRGACDMKGAIAAFVVAVAAFLAEAPSAGSVSLLITGDEEGPGRDGTVRVLDWMAAHGHIPDMCLVGEPTNPAHLGEMIKVGRRGSLNARIAVQGVQGHTAYPHRADNPAHRLVAVLAELIGAELDQGSDHFEPSSLQVTSVDVGNQASNVIPAAATARLNMRFNDRHTGAGLVAWLHEVVGRHAAHFDIAAEINGEPFVTPQGVFTAKLAAAVAEVTGRVPRLDTGGGTSDARFIARYCPVAEFGLVGASMHKVDEYVPLGDLFALAEIYRKLLHAVMA